MDKTQKEVTYLDFPLTKKLTMGGELKTLENSEALSQAIKIWISTQVGEKIRTHEGGILMPYIGKTLDDENAQKIKNVLQYGLESIFQPNLTVVTLEVVPNHSRNLWEITLIAYNIEMAVGINDKVLISNS